MNAARWPRAAGGAAVAGLLAALAACASAGMGSGRLAADGEPVRFDWHADGGATSGRMTAALPDGRVFSGPFVQMTRERRVDLEPMWAGWPRGWHDWRQGPLGPDVAFETVYGGQVVANLQGPGADRMRCRFTLNEPAAGMSGGGQGQCQLTGGGALDAVFPQA